MISERCSKLYLQTILDMQWVKELAQTPFILYLPMKWTWLTYIKMILAWTRNFAQSRICMI